MKPALRSLYLLVASTLVLAAIPRTLVQAKPSLTGPARLLAVRVKLPTIPNRGAPGNRRGGASRSETCVPLAGQLRLPTSSPGSSAPLPADAPPVAQELAALVPIYKTQVGQTSQQERFHVWGLTSVDRPTFWFNVPVSGEFYTAELALQDDDENLLYTLPVTLPATAGIVGVRLPAQVQPLEPGKLYHWFFKLKAKCDPKATTLTFVDGWVQRTQLEPATLQQLQAAAPLQQAEIYGQSGLWYDAVTTLAEVQLTQPQVRASGDAWTRLMQAAGLEKLTTVPVVQ